jgi:site-specific DNA-methyltransferase (adenine-specific)
MIVTKKIFESKHVDRDQWETPPEIFDPLNDEFSFTLDPCATPDNAKSKKFFTRFDNGLLYDWSGETVFVNPPYSGRNLAVWVEKCYRESLRSNTKVIGLLPVSTSSAWFHDYIYGKAEIRFIRGRIRFVGAKHTAPFSSMIVIFQP